MPLEGVTDPAMDLIKSLDFIERDALQNFCKNGKIPTLLMLSRLRWIGAISGDINSGYDVRQGLRGALAEFYAVRKAK